MLPTIYTEKFRKYQLLQRQGSENEPLCPEIYINILAPAHPGREGGRRRLPGTQTSCMRPLSGISGQRPELVTEFLWKMGASGRGPGGVKESAEEQADSHSHKGKRQERSTFLSKLLING